MQMVKLLKFALTGVNDFMVIYNVLLQPYIWQVDHPCFWIPWVWLVQDLVVKNVAVMVNKKNV